MDGEGEGEERRRKGRTEVCWVRRESQIESCSVDNPGFEEVRPDPEGTSFSLMKDWRTSTRSWSAVMDEEASSKSCHMANQSHQRKTLSEADGGRKEGGFLRTYLGSSGLGVEHRAFEKNETL